MKNRVNWRWIPLLALSVGACKKNEVPPVPELPAAELEVSAGKVSPPAPVAVTKLSVDERAAKLGFVQHLPQDTEVVLSFQNGTKTAGRLESSQLWQLMKGQLGGLMMFGDNPEMLEEDLVPPDAEQDATAAEEPAEAAEEMGAAALFGQEFTLALGRSSGEQIGNLFTFYRRMGYFQMRTMAKAFAGSLQGGDLEKIQAALAEPYDEEFMSDLLKDPESGMQLLEKSSTPPIYLAFKTRRADREAGAQLLAATVANLALLGEMVEAVEVENSGHKFTGYKVLGEKIAASMAADRTQMDSDLGREMTDRLLALIAKRNILVLTGSVGDYAVMFSGASESDLNLAPSASQSIVASEALAFADAYASKEIAALAYGEKASMDALIAASGGLADMTNGLRDGLAESDGLGETRDLEAMFQIVAERENALRKLASNESSGMLAYFEDGLKIESFGGTDSGMVDWAAPRKLAHLGDSEDVVMFVNSPSNADYQEKASAYMEALFETGYALTMKVAESPLEGPEMAQFKEMTELFDGKFRADMVGMWEALGQAASAGLGQESALVIDLKGSAPAVPGIPQKVLDEGRIPRISWVAPVKERAKLASSWQQMSSTLTGALGKISELTGTDIPMQKPISSERDGNTSWFIAMPFLTDDFLPSITVGDAWFAASTSKNHALDLIGKAQAGGEPATGLWFSMNFKALENYMQSTYELVKSESGELLGAPLSADQQALMEGSIKVLGDLDKLTVHSRREGAELRTSIHLKTR